jgi:hypothetical protein
MLSLPASCEFTIPFFRCNPQHMKLFLDIGTDGNIVGLHCNQPQKMPPLVIWKRWVLELARSTDQACPLRWPHYMSL